MPKKTSNVSVLNPAPYGRWVASLHLTRMSDGTFRLQVVNMAHHEIESRGEAHEILTWLADQVEGAIPDFKTQAEALKP